MNHRSHEDTCHDMQVGIPLGVYATTEQGEFSTAKAVADMIAENKRLREALRFYADPDAYDEDMVDEVLDFLPAPVMADGGRQARLALGKHL